MPNGVETPSINLCTTVSSPYFDPCEGDVPYIQGIGSIAGSSSALAVGQNVPDPCSLFTGGSIHGYCFNFTKPTSMLDSGGAIASVGEEVRTIVPEGGTFSNFQTFSSTPARPLCGSGYLQFTGLSGPTTSTTPEAQGVYNSISNGGFTICCVATQPSGFSGDGFATLMSCQDGAQSNQSQYRMEFTPTGLNIISFNSSSFQYTSATYSSSPGDVSVITARANGSTMSVFRNGALIATGAALLNSGSLSYHEFGASRAGTNNTDYGEYSGFMYAVYFIDRPMTDQEVANYYSWAQGLF